ncbi:MAG: hypothetical protein ACRDT2_20925, partial [Natronosporangium sp.]
MRFLVPQDEAEWDERRDLLDRAATDPDARGRVDSGRFAEPFWYVDSPLTTPSPVRRFGGRPPKGDVPAPVPGVRLPDAPVRLPGAPGARLRDLSRDGLLVLVTEDVDQAGVTTVAAASAVTQGRGRLTAGYAPLRPLAAGAPCRVHALPELDPDGTVRTMLATRPGEAWLIRPDGHIAAVLTDPGPAAVTAAVHRVLGHSADPPADKY